jgi:hypothetical protein
MTDATLGMHRSLDAGCKDSESQRVLPCRDPR